MNEIFSPDFYDSRVSHWGKKCYCYCVVYSSGVIIIDHDHDHNLPAQRSARSWQLQLYVCVFGS